jgi:hypothetical protein
MIMGFIISGVLLGLKLWGPLDMTGAKVSNILRIILTLFLVKI